MTLLLFPRPRRSLRDREVWRFTHEDVKNGVVHFAPDPREAERILEELRRTAAAANGNNKGAAAPADADSFKYR